MTVSLSLSQLASQPPPTRSIPQLKSTLEKDNNDKFFIVMCLAVFTCRLRLMAAARVAIKIIDEIGCSSVDYTFYLTGISLDLFTKSVILN